jgi:hypothetical protein
MIARRGRQLVLELRRIEGSLVGDLSHAETLIQARCARRTVVDQDHLTVPPPGGPHPVTHLAPTGIQGEASHSPPQTQVEGGQRFAAAQAQTTSNQCHPIP